MNLLVEQALARLLRPLKIRLYRLINRAVLNAVNANGKVQLVEVAVGKNETLHDVEHAEPYGFTAHPKKGAEALVASLAGDRAHTVVLVVGDRRYRLAGLVEGEVAMYDDQGQQIVMRRDNIEINAPKGFVINGQGEIHGNLAVIGSTTFTGSVEANGHAIDQTHRHSGVTGGSGTTGVVT